MPCTAMIWVRIHRGMSMLPGPSQPLLTLLAGVIKHQSKWFLGQFICSTFWNASLLHLAAQASLRFSLIGIASSVLSSYVNLCIRFRCIVYLYCLQDDSSCKSIFYQDTDGTIRERKYGTPPRGDTQTWQWHPTRFDNPGTLLGTSIAGVETGVNTSVVLFFQDDEGFLLYRWVNLTATARCDEDGKG